MTAAQELQAPGGVILTVVFPEWEIFHRRQPTCLNCQQPAVRHITSPGNQNGNAGRPYYTCPNCEWEKRWVCWADTRGIRDSNPKCDCELPSRQDRIGRDKGYKVGRGFWACATGTCRFYSENEDGTPGCSTDGFHPWLCSEVDGRHGINSTREPTTAGVGGNWSVPSITFPFY